MDVNLLFATNEQYNQTSYSSQLQFIYKLEKIIVLPLEGYDENFKKVKYLTHLVLINEYQLLTTVINVVYTQFLT